MRTLRVCGRTNSIRLPCLYYFFLAVVVIRYETTATARWALLFIVRAFFNDTITVAVWTGFHVRLMGMLPSPPIISAGASLIRHLMSKGDRPVKTALYSVVAIRLKSPGTL